MTMERPVGLRGKLTSYGDPEFALFLRRAFIKGAGYTDDSLDRPVVGIVDTRSAFNPCHGNVPQLIDAIRRGVLQAGGIAFEFPTISLHESFSYPTSMFLRNLMSMDTEEMIQALPVDSVVLIGGCDKTVPAQLMGAVSANKPAIQLVTGSMLTGSYEGRRVGACSDCRYFWGEYRAEVMTASEINRVNSNLVGSVGTCSVAGTASTMACLAEALGMALPGSATPPAVTADRFRVAERTGKRAVELALEQLTPDQILSPAAFTNAFRILMAMGGSTNAIVHLAAVAGRAGFALDLRELGRIGVQTPVLLDLKPSGDHYMEDFHAAGGVPRLMQELVSLLDTKVMTVTGRTLAEEIDDYPAPFDQQVIRSVDDPLQNQGAITVLYGNLAPDGAVIKRSTVSGNLMRHTGRAVVFDGVADMAERIDRDDLDVSEEDVLVLKNIGPVGGPGMPEAGYIPIPKKLAIRGVRDMVRISDGRMSGTAAGTIVLHIAPEAAVGGPLSLVRDGDQIEIDVESGTINLAVPESELRQRSMSKPESSCAPARGYAKLFHETVTQAEKGVDFDFLLSERVRGVVPCKTEQKVNND